MNVYHDAQYSRYPIHDESFDEIIGVLNMKDLLFIDIDKEHFDVKKYMRETLWSMNLIKSMMFLLQ